MAKMVVEIKGASKDMLKSVMGSEMEKKFNKNPIVKNVVSVTYED